MKILSWIIIIILSAGFASIGLTRSALFYKIQYEEFSVYNEFKGNKDQAHKSLESVISYIAPFGSELDEDLFYPKDIVHLYDVKVIVKNLYLLVIFFIFLTIILIAQKKITQSYISTWSRLAKFYLIFSVILYFLVSYNFDFFFIKWHEFSFDNDYWLLDPKTSNLIKLFPQEIFFRVFVIIYSSTVIINILLIILNELAKKHEKRK